MTDPDFLSTTVTTSRVEIVGDVLGNILEDVAFGDGAPILGPQRPFSIRSDVPGALLCCLWPLQFCHDRNAMLVAGSAR